MLVLSLNAVIDLNTKSVPDRVLATTALTLSAGVATADVALSGDGRMGIMYDNSAANKFSFTSRARVTFTLSGETDSGASFGGSFRADHAGAGGAVAGNAGSVFVSGEFGRLTMGDTAGAAQFVVGHVAGVGLTGLGDLNESLFLGNNVGVAATDQSRPTARYDYSIDAFTVAISHTNPGSNDSTAAIGASYDMDMFSAGLGFERLNVSGGQNITHGILGLRASFEGVDLAANYGRVNSSAGLANNDQYSVSVGGTFDATTVTAYYARNFGGAKSYGLGASYDLGGGAAFTGGVVRTDSDGQIATPTASSRTIADLGLAFTF